MVVFLEVRPVERHDDLFALGDHEAHPRFEEAPNVEAVVAQESVDLLDAVLGLPGAHGGVGGPDGVDGAGAGVQDAGRGVRDRFEALGMGLLAEHRRHERVEVAQVEGGGAPAGGRQTAGRGYGVRHGAVRSTSQKGNC